MSGTPVAGGGRGFAARGNGGDPLAALSRQVVLVVAGWLLACAAVGWILTVRQANAMSGMASGLGQIGTGMAVVTVAPVFLAMWVGMMVAMMFPTAVPMVAVHYTVVRRRGEGALPTVAFVAGYLLAWSAAGVLPLTALLGFRYLSASAGGSRWLPTLAGIALTIAGLYQFSRWKSICLRTCRSPFAFLMEHDFGGGHAAFRAGLTHGTYCLGCCWALMSVLLVVGLMNLVWMVALSLVFLAEKCWRRGEVLTHILGTALALLGAAVVIHPPLLHLIAGATTAGM